MSTTTEDPKRETSPELAAPKFKGEETVPFNCPVQSAKHALAICDTLDTSTAQKARSTITSKVQRKYDGEPPYSDKKLAEDNQDWRHNFSVRAVSTVVSRNVPGFIATIDSLRSFTNSSLPERVDPGQKKSAIFQEAVTRTIRAWPGLRDLNYSLAVELNLHGPAITAPLDDIEWRPKLFRVGEFLLFENTMIEADTIPFIALKVPFRPDELLERIKDPKAAEHAGWDVANVRRVLENAKAIPRSDTADQRSADDARREGSEIASTLTATGVRGMVVIYRDFNGKCGQYILEYKSDGATGGDKNSKCDPELFFKEDMYGRMGKAISVFAIEPGNSRVYGARGVGRMIANIAITSDRAHNLFADMVWLSALLIVKTKSGADIPELHVQTAPLAVLQTDGETDEKTLKFNFDLTAVQGLIGQLDVLLERMAGAYLPGNINEGGDSKTAREIVTTASREDAIKGATLARWLGQYLLMCGSMQRRICTADHIKEAMKRHKIEVDSKTPKRIVTKEFYAKAQKMGGDISGLVARDLPAHLDMEAVNCCRSMIEQGLTPLEILEIAESPSVESLSDVGPVRDAAIQAVTSDTMYVGNPQIDQQKLLRMRLTSQLGPESADDLILPDAGATNIVEQQRQQLIEIGTMIQGVPVPISERDDDLVHLKTGFEYTGSVVGNIVKNPRLLIQEHVREGELELKHFADHLASAEKKGIQAAELAPYRKMHGELGKFIEDAKAALAQEAQLRGEQQAPQQPAGPPAGPGEPVPGSNGPLEPSATVVSPQTASSLAAGGTTVPEQISPSATIDEALRATATPTAQQPLPPL